MAAFSRHEAALSWACDKAAAAWGKIAMASPAFAFEETDYYTATMGAGLKKQFFAFDQLIDPAELVDRKLQSNDWESEYAALGRHDEARPLNLDPGYFTLAKLVLASTKDHAHRLYLGRGIYAEITLHFRNRDWQASDWTYPDYRRGDFQEFFSQCREYLKGNTSGHI
jgi:Domain of unknown function (DUF4416)